MSIDNSDQLDSSYYLARIDRPFSRDFSDSSVHQGIYDAQRQSVKNIMLQYYRHKPLRFVELMQNKINALDNGTMLKYAWIRLSPKDASFENQLVNYTMDLDHFKWVDDIVFSVLEYGGKNYHPHTHTVLKLTSLKSRSSILSALAGGKGKKLWSRAGVDVKLIGKVQVPQKVNYCLKDIDKTEFPSKVLLDNVKELCLSREQIDEELKGLGPAEDNVLTCKS